MMNRLLSVLGLASVVFLSACAVDEPIDEESIGSEQQEIERRLVVVSCDADGDGYDSDSEACGGDDCDDTSAIVYPGCILLDPTPCQGDGKDNDCDGEVDEDDECRDAGCHTPVCVDPDPGR